MLGSWPCAPSSLLGKHAKGISSPQPFSGNRLAWIPLSIVAKGPAVGGEHETVVE